jgi:DNA-directed RNA polymerase specialized sigma subunit
MTLTERLYADIRALRANSDPAERSRCAWEIVCKNPRLVAYIARTVFRRTGEDDLSEARIAFHAALLYIDPDRGSVFRVARWKALRAMSTLHGIHVPHGARERFRVWVRDGGARGENIPTTLSEEERVRIRILLYPSAEDRAENGTRTSRPLEPQYDEIEDERLDLVYLLDLLEGMNTLSRASLLVPYDEEVTLEDVGKRHGLSRERIRQISNQRFQILQKHFRTP